VFRARERGFKQFKCPVRNVLIRREQLQDSPHGGWLDSRAGLGVSEKRKISCSNLYSNSGPSSPQPSRPTAVFRLRSKHVWKNFEKHFSTFCFGVRKRIKYEERRQTPQQTWESQIKVTLLGVVCKHSRIVYRSFISIFQLAVRKLSCQINVYLTGMFTDILS
jgi:hypothetical protein